MRCHLALPNFESSLIAEDDCLHSVQRYSSHKEYFWKVDPT
jgi:hypothetical protein